MDTIDCVPTDCKRFLALSLPARYSKAQGGEIPAFLIPDELAYRPIVVPPNRLMLRTCAPRIMKHKLLFLGLTFHALLMQFPGVIMPYKRIGILICLLLMCFSVYGQEASVLDPHGEQAREIANLWSVMLFIAIAVYG